MSGRRLRPYELIGDASLLSGHGRVLAWLAVDGQRILDEIPISLVENSKADPFWYKDRALRTYFNHRNARRGARFYDGNNGDRWRVLYINREHCRAFIQNISQGGVRLAFWTDREEP